MKFNKLLVVFWMLIIICDAFTPVLAAEKNPEAKKYQFSKKELQEGVELYNKKCNRCHGKEGHGGIGTAIGCHGVKNKSDNFLFELIYYGRKGDHGIDMPSWGAWEEGETGEANKLKNILKSSKKFSSEKINEFIRKIYGYEGSFFIKKKKGVGFVFYPMTSSEINLVIRYLRYLEIKQEKTLPQECFVKRESTAKGDIENGKQIYVKKCAQCHGMEGRGDDPFFKGKDLVPRDFTDKLYMNSKTDNYLMEIVRSGGLSKGRSGIMTPNKMNNKELKDMISYIRTF